MTEEKDTAAWHFVVTVVVAVAVAVQCSRTCNYNLLDEPAPAFRTKQPSPHRMTHSQTSRVLVVVVVVVLAAAEAAVDAAEAVVDGVVAVEEVACNASIVGRLGCSSIADT